MGGGSFSSSSFSSYSSSRGRSYDSDSGRVSGQIRLSSACKDVMKPKKKIRECVNSEEHPNTIPVILGLDVTGSMGSGIKECAQALGVIMTDLYKKFKDIEFCVMGIGDFAYDDAPLQVSQFESDVRIAESIDNLYFERGGGGNKYESYTSAWWYGLNRTKLDAFDKQGRKGIIITMGDEQLNPSLPRGNFEEWVGKLDSDQKFTDENLRTDALYEAASKKFEIFHISVSGSGTSYDKGEGSYEENVDKSWQILGENYKISTVNELSKTIVKCVEEAVNKQRETVEVVGGPQKLNEQQSGDGITW